MCLRYDSETMSSSDSNVAEIDIDALVAKLPKSGRGAGKIAKILLETDFELDDVVCFKNAEVTKAFLNKKDTISDLEIANSLDYSMTYFDVQNVEVLLHNVPDIKNSRKLFVACLVGKTIKAELIDLQVVDVFLKQAMEWDVLDEREAGLIAFHIFQKANRKALQMYLQCDFDLYVKKSFKINVLPYAFGNKDKNAIKLLLKLRKFDLEAREDHGFTALHWAASTLCFDNIKYLLDHGAEPNSLSPNNVTPLAMVLKDVADQPQIEILKCAEFWLQYGADMLFTPGGGGITVAAYVLSIHSCYFLVKLILTHLAIREAAGADIQSIFQKLIYPKTDYRKFYSVCREQLEELKKHKIRKNLTLFTIISKTGKELFRHVNMEDRKIASEIIDRHRRKLHSHYVRTLREHMRQLRNLVECENKAMLVLSEIILPNQLILKEITSYLTYQDLLKFQ